MKDYIKKELNNMAKGIVGIDEKLFGIKCRTQEEFEIKKELIGCIYCLERLSIYTNCDTFKKDIYIEKIKKGAREE